MFYRAVCRFSFIKFVFGIICLCAECWSVRVSERRRRNFIKQFIPKHAHIRQMPAAIHPIDCDLFAFESTVATVNVINYWAICERCRRAVSFFLFVYFSLIFFAFKQFGIQRTGWALPHVKSTRPFQNWKFTLLTSNRRSESSSEATSLEREKAKKSKNKEKKKRK